MMNVKKIPDDERIVELYALGDEYAILYTKEKYGTRLLRLSKNLCNDMSTAEECENDTYLTAWNRIPPDSPKTYFFNYLARIIRFITINRVKELSAKKRYAVLTELTSEMEECIPSAFNVEDEIDGKELSRIVSEFLHIRSEETRNIFIRRYWFFDSVSEISKRFSVSEGKVKTVLFRIRNELRTYLEKEGIEL